MTNHILILVKLSRGREFWLKKKWNNEKIVWTKKLLLPFHMENRCLRRSLVKKYSKMVFLGQI
uniref:Uncharacterized protein n=1 Tax=Lepeophtheirus salmonis TaxID=72036 RepID=A0A0K2VJP9_LEPSM